MIRAKTTKKFIFINKMNKDSYLDEDERYNASRILEAFVMRM
jgi:hypothetical protein